MKASVENNNSESHQHSGRRSDLKEGELREKIREAAMAVFAEKGFEGASINDIAKRAGCTKPMIFYYFGSKEELFYELFDYMHNNSMNALHHILEDGDATFEERVKQIILVNQDYMQRSNGELRFFQAMSNGESKTKEVMKNCHIHHVIEVYDLLVQAAQWAIEANEIEGDPRTIAGAFYSVLFFSGLQNKIANDITTCGGQNEDLLDNNFSKVDVEDLLEIMFKGIRIKPIKTSKEKKNSRENKR